MAIADALEIVASPVAHGSPRGFLVIRSRDEHANLSEGAGTACQIGASSEGTTFVRTSSYCVMSLLHQALKELPGSLL
jgi:hypothetical protein